MVAAACSSSPSTGGGATPTASGKPVAGGKIVLGAEQYPECINPVTQCASASWLFWDTTIYLFPRPVIWGVDGKVAASPLISELPSLDNGGLTQSPFTVRYKINTAAKWSDGTPITCADFDFTRNAILNTKGTYTTVGYAATPGGSGISSIDCTDPHTAVLKFSGPFADWPDVFGGGAFGLLEKAAFPNVNAAKPDVSKEMQSSISFSGGPWKLQSWSTQQTVLVPNTNYWVKNSLGRPTYFDQVTIVPRTDATTEVNDLLSGAIDAIFPQPDVSQAKLFASNSAVKFVGTPGQYFESLWFNVSKAPFNDPVVRNGLFWAVDRQKVVSTLINPVDKTQTGPLGCGIFALAGTFWCDTQPFAQFHYDTNMVTQVMTAGGYAKDSKGFWAKGGQEVKFVYETTMKPRRIQTQARDQRNQWQTDQVRQKRHHGITAISHDDQLPRWQPAVDLSDHLSRPVRDRLVPLLALLMIALPGGKHGQKGQSPHPSCPRDRREQHHRNPTQPAGFDKELLARTDRITIDAAGGDFAAATTLNRFIYPDHHRGIVWHKQGDEQPQQNPTQGSARPVGSIEDAMIVLKLPVIGASHDAQDGCHRSFSWSQDRSDQEYLGPFPDGWAENRFKRSQNEYNSLRQIAHLSSFLVIRYERSVLCLPFFVQSMDKV